MKANKKFINKAGESAIIGVILMVAITVAISATVYVYVSGMINIENESIIVMGKIEHLINYEYDNYIVEINDTIYIITEYQFNYLDNLLDLLQNKNVTLYMNYINSDKIFLRLNSINLV